MFRPMRRRPFLKPADDRGHQLLITTKLEGRDALPQAVYYLAFAAVGVPLCVSAMITEPLPEPATAALLLVLGLASYHVPVTLPSNVQFHPGFPLLMAALFCHGRVAADIVIVPSALLHFFTRNHGLSNCLFNAGQFALCAHAAEIVGFRSGWTPGAPAGAKDLLPVCLMMLTFDVLNILFVSGSRSIENKEPWRECFTKLLYVERKAVLPQRAFQSIVAMLLSSHMGNIAFVIVFLGAMSLRLQNIFQKELVERTEAAETDPLTKVHNMRYLNKWLTTAFGTAGGGKETCSFLFADIDKLKAANDEYGHETGDNLLIHVAQILTDNVRSKDQIARYGGDEFVVALPGVDLQQAIAAAMRILQASSKPFWVNGQEVGFGISIGVASWPEHGETVFDAIHIADEAMYAAKKNGGNRVHSARKS